MIKTIKRLTSLLLAGVLLTALLSACGAEQRVPSNADAVDPSTSPVRPLNEAVFSDSDLTLVNVFATWCSPCIQEIPDLQELQETMRDRGVQVIGVVLDTLNPDGTINTDAMASAQDLIELAEVSYPFYIPDTLSWDGALTTITSVPTTFFVDRDGTIVSGAYVGARDLDSWTEIVETELANLEAAA